MLLLACFGFGNIFLVVIFDESCTCWIQARLVLCVGNIMLHDIPIWFFFYVRLFVLSM